MPGLSDADSALIAMSKMMEKVTAEMGRLAVSAGMAHHAMDQDFTQQFANFHWAINAMIDTLPFQTEKGRRGGSGGPYFDGMESEALSGGGPGGSGRSGGKKPKPPPKMTDAEMMAELYPDLGISEELNGPEYQTSLSMTSGKPLSQWEPYRHMSPLDREMPPPYRPYYPSQSVPSSTDDEFAPRRRGAPHSQAVPSATDDEFAPLRRPQSYDESTPWRSAGRGRKGLSHRRFQSHDRKHKGFLVPLMGGSLNPFGRSANGMEETSDPSDPYGLHYGKPGGTIIPNGYKPFRRKIKDAFSSLGNTINQELKGVFGPNTWRKAGQLVRSGTKNLLTGVGQGAVDKWASLKKNLTGENPAGVQFGKSILQHTGMALQSASPDSFATLTGSFKLLSAVIGSELTPYANAASLQIQHLARSFEGADKHTKAWIGLGSAIGVASAGLLILAPQFVALAKIFTSLGGGKASKWLGGVAMAHPVLAVGAVAAAGASIYASAKLDALQKHKDELELKTHVEEVDRTPEHLKKDKIYQELAPLFQSQTPQTKMKATKRAGEILRGYYSNVQESEYQLQEHLGLRTERTPMDQMNVAQKGIGFLKGLWNTTTDSDRTMELEKDLANAKAKYTEASQSVTLAERGENFFKFTRTKMDPELKKAKQKLSDEQIMQAAPLLKSFQNRVQPAYYGVEDLYKRIQLSALSESPLDQEILRIQRDNFEELVKSNGTLTEIANNLGFGLGK